LSKESQVLQDLSNQQVERALAWLASPLLDPPPQGLENLNDLEWMLLERLLENLMLERAHNPMQ
jgi:hypothetical protein